MYILLAALAASTVLFVISCIILAYENDSKVMFWISVVLLIISMGLALYLNAYVIAYILFLLFVLTKYISGLNFPRGG